MGRMSTQTNNIMGGMNRDANINAAGIHNGFIGGINSGNRQSQDAMTNMARLCNQAFRQAMQLSSPSRLYRDNGRNIVQGLINGVNERIAQASASLRNLATQSNSAFNAVASQWQFSQFGRDINQGLINGLNGNSGSVFWTVENIARNIVNQFRRTMQISSPSRLFEYFGEMTGLGYEKGIESSFEKVLVCLEYYADKVSKCFESMELGFNATGFKLSMPDLSFGRPGFASMPTKPEMSDSNNNLEQAIYELIETMRRDQGTTESDLILELDGAVIVQTAIKEILKIAKQKGTIL